MPLSPPLHVETWLAATPVRRGVALLLHGAESHAGWFDSVGRGLAARGVTAVAYDRRGWGQSLGRRGHLADGHEALSELRQIATELGGKYGPVHLVGLSWGGLLALRALRDDAGLYASVTLLAPGLYPKKRPSLWRMLFAGKQGAIPLPLKPVDFTTSLVLQGRLLDDPFRVAAVSRGFCLATVKLLSEVRRPRASRVPLCAVLASEDSVIDNVRTKALVEKWGGEIHVLSARAHSLVLEDPAGVTAILSGIVDKGSSQHAS